MQKVIALDIGSYSIKAVEIVNTFKSYEITNFYENVIPHLEGVPLDAVIPACMEQLFAENDLQADRIVTAMPGQFISSRALSFNFSDTRKIETAVFAEVEDAVPFNMEDMILDHQILGSAGGKTFALAVMTRKAFLKNFLDLLQRINIDPKFVDVDSLAFYNLSSFMNVQANESFAMVDVGHEKTSVCIVRDGVLRMFRSINLGGRYVTEFLARDLETSFHDAQRIKHRCSRVLCSTNQGEDLTGDDRFVAERMTLACNAIVKELGRTLYAFKTWDKQPLSRIFVSGGASNVANFGQFLEDQLEVPTQATKLEATELKISPDLAEFYTIMPQSVAIGMRTVTSVRKHSQINLRRGEFAYVQNYEVILKYGMSALRVVAAVVGILAISWGLKWYFYRSQIDALETQYKSTFMATFPDLKRKYQGGSAPFERIRKDAESRLKREINSKGSSVSNFVVENSSSPALLLLKDLSEGISKDVKLDVVLFDLTRASATDYKLQFRVETDGYDFEARVDEALKKISSLQNVTIKASSAKPGSNGKVIQTTFQADYVRPDSLDRASS